MARRRLYPAPFPIGPNRHPGDQIRDAEAFCDTHLRRAFREWDDMHLPPEDYDDCLQLLITHLWRMSETFDPERNDSFANFARTYLPKRAADVSTRRILGRNGSRIHNYLHDTLAPPQREHRPDTALTVEPSHTDPDRGSTLERPQPDRDRDTAWAARVLGLRAA